MKGSRAQEPESAALGHLRRHSRDSLYSVAFLAVIFPPVAALNGGPGGAVELVVLGVGWAVFNAVFLPGALSVLRDPWRVRSLRTGVPLLVLGVVLTVLAALWLSSGVLWAVLPGLAAAELLANRPTRLIWPVVVAVVLVTAGLVLLVSQANAVPEMVREAVLAGVVIGTTSYMQETSVRLWRSSLELDNARQEAAELATTRERLRLSQDLHDILGHALEVVSLKSELAARLSTVDPGRAHAEMVEVQELARGALQDVRALAHAQRTTDLVAELAGARKLLASAEIRCEVDARPEELPAAQRELFGWVLREAVTNLLRHADARRCWITLGAQGDLVVLTVGNDGVLAAGEWGSGLSGLAERIAGGGGSFAAAARDGEFVVTASLPKVEVAG
ncbi:histidine kinase [Crossiella sp. SN42]|uniref:sensor histidine kinase n=1 Tax=Crossiella sp. SN42 TaxID=2944808 RepID=UPI00207C1D13|nr:histidine kinase [Crossiella sp. SN42]MCO1581453.1 histidine kinase [Crossiella sp. SN42]